ncbi:MULTISPECIES: hypothetical protein [Burkholderia]|uniref:hypothetical protein n=1 Tax=Burkholderia TaxID=32008 RepID=UPI001E2AEB2D|nr:MULTISPECIES: hypothetical protein [unclassified Burkholderia]UEP31039.1 hypothetical protein LMA01_17590 [Burkholderia sp. B21-007]UEP43683.1 hypothetical protein LMA02_26910 [Burkholderia sp. B21-005]
MSFRLCGFGVAFALGAAILAYPARVVEREIRRGNAADRAVSFAMPSRQKPPEKVSTGFQPAPSYLIIRPERRAPAVIGHVDA